MKKFIRILLILLCFNFLSGCNSSDTSDDFIIANTVEGRKLLQVTESGALKSRLVIPSGVEIIGTYAFQSSVLSLVEVTIPASVNIIEDYAFYSCINLEKVNIIGKTGFEKIGEYAFANCMQLRKIVLNGEITDLDSASFYNCVNLVVYTDNQSTLMRIHEMYNVRFIIVPRAIYDNLKYYSMEYYNVYCEDDIIDNFIMEEDKLICYLGTDKKITIPNEAKTIDEEAFENNKNIREVVIHKNVSQIGNYAFYGCTKLQKVTFASQSKFNRINYKTFAQCKSLTSINLPDTIEVIDGEAFKDCSNLSLKSLPSSLIRIGDSAFSGCRNLNLKSLPPNLEIIDDSAFAFCSFDTDNLILSDKINLIGDYAFQGVSIPQFTLASSIEEVGSWPFLEGSKLVITGNSNNYQSWNLRLQYYDVTYQ